MDKHTLGITQRPICFWVSHYVCNFLTLFLSNWYLKLPVKLCVLEASPLIFLLANEAMGWTCAWNPQSSSFLRTSLLYSNPKFRPPKGRVRERNLGQTCFLDHATPLLTVHTILLHSFIFFCFCEQKGLSVHTFFLSGKTYLKLSMRFYVFCFVLFFLHVNGDVRMKSQANEDVPWELKVIGYGINWGYFRVFRKSNAKTKIKWVHFHLLGSRCIESDSLKILQIIT